jgi:hypothetical protein
MNMAAIAGPHGAETEHPVGAIVERTSAQKAWDTRRKNKGTAPESGAASKTPDAAADVVTAARNLVKAKAQLTNAKANAKTAITNAEKAVSDAETALKKASQELLTPSTKKK